MTTTINATEVNVYKRQAANGHLHFQYDFKVTMPDGTIYRERRKARGATSESAARQIGLRRLHDVLRRGPNPRKTAERLPTVEEFAPMWLEAGRAERQKPSTLHNKEVLLRCHLLPLLGKLRLDEVTLKEIDRVKAERKHLEPGSVNNLLKYIVAMLRCAKAMSSAALRDGPASTQVDGPPAPCRGRVSRGARSRPGCARCARRLRRPGQPLRAPQRSAPKDMTEVCAGAEAVIPGSVPDGC